MSSECLFCRIVSGEVPAEIVRQTDRWVAFRDINPQAPTHVLIVPREHIDTLNDIGLDDASLIGELFLAAKEIADEEGISDDGYRTVINTNAGAGQSVFHVHLHLLGGRTFRWPPG